MKRHLNIRSHVRNLFQIHPNPPQMSGRISINTNTMRYVGVLFAFKYKIPMVEILLHYLEFVELSVFRLYLR